MYVTLQYLSDWCLHGVYFDRNSGGKISQVEPLSKLNARSFGYFECSTALWLLLDPSCKSNLLQELAGRFRSRLSPDAQNRAFGKNVSCIQILGTTLLMNYYNNIISYIVNDFISNFRPNIFVFIPWYYKISVLPLLGFLKLFSNLSLQVYASYPMEKLGLQCEA